MTDPLDQQLAERQAKAKATKRKSSGDRWARLNSFVDISMREVTANESKVWLHLYRYERGGVVDASVRQIATGTGLHRNSTQNAIHGLMEKGLLEVLKRARHHGEATVYRLKSAPSPSQHR